MSQLVFTAVVYFLATDFISPFPLSDCDTKETIVEFRMECQHQVEEQSDFVKKLEDYLKTNGLLNIVKVFYSITGLQNGTTWHRDIPVNSSSLLTPTALDECRMDKFYNESHHNLTVRDSIKYRRLLIYFDSEKVKPDDANLKRESDENKLSENKYFMITDNDVLADFVYRTDSYKKLNVLEMYQKMCNSNCKGFNIYYNGFQKSFYHVIIRKNPPTTYESGLEFCIDDQNTYLLSIETYDELEYITSIIAPDLRYPSDKTFKILLGYKNNKWQSGNPFLWYIPFQTNCLYLRVKFSENGKTHESWFESYNCTDDLTNAYIICECHEYINFDSYSRISYFQTSEKNNSVFSVDLSIYEKETLGKKSMTMETKNCLANGNSIDNVLKQYLCGKTKDENGMLKNATRHDMDIVCARQGIYNDLVVQQTYESTKLLSNETAVPLAKSFDLNIDISDGICSFNSENLIEHTRSKHFNYFSNRRDSQLNNVSMSYKIEPYTHNYSCPPSYYQCVDSVSCVDLKRLNDRRRDCPLGDDERFSQASFICFGVVLIKVKDVSHKLQCHESNFSNQENLSRKKQNNNRLNEKQTTEFKEIRSLLYNVSFSIVPDYALLLYFPVVDILQIQSTECEITDFKTSFKYWDTSYLISLNLSKNLLINIDFLANLSNLRQVDLSYNEPLTIGDELEFPHLLEYIDLSYTSIHSLPVAAFDRLPGLTLLNVSYTKIHKFENIQVPKNFRIHTLNIRGLVMVDLHNNYFQDLIIDSQILADDFRLCCPVILGMNIDQRKCIAPSDIISTCHHLVGDTFKRIIIWIVGLLTLSGNGAVVIYRIKWSQWAFAKAYDIFVTGLAVSDLMMGVYLIIIASVDVHYRDLYVLKHLEWKHGNICYFSGFLSTLSSEMSTFFIYLITVDRFMAIAYPFGEHKFSKIGIKLTLLFFWLVGFLLALVPAVYPGWEIYSSNGLCLPLPLSTQRFNGWQYSVAIFVFLNFIFFIIIALGQIAIFVSATKCESSLICKQHKPRARSREITIAKKLAFVAMSDFLCWFPIGIMGMFTLNGFEFNPESYAWMAVFVLPVNSALNPFIYTIPAVYSRFKT